MFIWKQSNFEETSNEFRQFFMKHIFQVFQNCKKRLNSYLEHGTDTERIHLLAIELKHQLLSLNVRTSNLEHCVDPSLIRTNLLTHLEEIHLLDYSWRKWILLILLCSIGHNQGELCKRYDREFGKFLRSIFEWQWLLLKKWMQL